MASAEQPPPPPPPRRAAPKKKRKKVVRPSQFEARQVMGLAPPRREPIDEELSDDETEYRAHLLREANRRSDGKEGKEEKAQVPLPPDEDGQWYAGVRSNNARRMESDAQAALDEEAQLEAVARHNAALAHAAGGSPDDDGGDDDDPHGEDGKYIPIPLPGYETDLFVGLTPEHRAKEEAAALEPDQRCYLCWGEKPKRGADGRPTAYETMLSNIYRDMHRMSHRALCDNIQKFYERRIRPRIEHPADQRYWSLKSISDHLRFHAPTPRLCMEDVARMWSVLSHVLATQGVYLEHSQTGRRAADIRAVRELVKLGKERAQLAEKLKIMQDSSL